MADQQKYAADQGALHRLVKLLTSPPSQGSSTETWSTQAAAAWALGKLAEHASAEIVEAKAVPALLHLLKPMSAASLETQMSALALYGLARQVSDSLAQAGTLTALVELLRTPAFPPDVPLAILAVLVRGSSQAAEERQKDLRSTCGASQYTI